MEDSPKSKHELGLPAVLAVVAGFFLVVWFFVLPRLVGGGPAKGSLIEDNLKYIYLAKQLWASDHSMTKAVQVTEQDLTPYTDIIRRVDGEQYTINPIGTPPEAQLMRALKPWPKGTVIRLREDGRGQEIILPGIAVQAAAAAPSSKETNGTSSAAGSAR